MSYILEALKKAQAERQLGSVPTIDARPIHASIGPAPLNKALWLALGAVALLLALLALLLLREQGARSPTALIPAGVTQPDVTKAASKKAATQKAVETHIVAEMPKPAEVPKLAAAQKVAETPKLVAVQKAAEAPKPPEAPKPSVSMPTAPPPVPSEASVASLRELPEPIQRQIPIIAIGGYIYSKNPADRLLLIDKVLRSEGDELAPGLMLEKLQPGSAIFNFRGYRYRVPY